MTKGGTKFRAPAARRGRVVALFGGQRSRARRTRCAHQRRAARLLHIRRTLGQPPGTVWKASKRPVLEEAGRDLVMPPSAVRNRPLGTGDNSRTPDPDQPPRVWISGSFRIGGPISVTVRDRCALGPGRADQDHQVGGIRAHRRAVGMPCPSTGAGEVLGSGFVFIFEAPGVAGTPGCGAGPWGILPPLTEQ